MRASRFVLAAALSLGVWTGRAHALAGLPAAFGPPVCSATLPAAQPHPSTGQMLQVQESAAADPSFLLSPEPVDNIGALRFRIRDYVDCTGAEGCYWADLDAQTRRAMDALDARVQRRHAGERLALVLDIDETSLTNYCENVREDFGFFKTAYNDWLVSPAASMPIDGTLRLFQRAKQQGVAVFFITGRGEAMRTGTERDLRTAGYDGWQHLSLKQPEDAGKSTEQYKSAERAKIAAAGYTLALNMGDQWNDLNGAPLAERSVKLPNPFYYLP